MSVKQKQSTVKRQFVKELPASHWNQAEYYPIDKRQRFVWDDPFADINALCMAYPQSAAQPGNYVTSLPEYHVLPPSRNIFTSPFKPAKKEEPKAMNPYKVVVKIQDLGMKEFEYGSEAVVELDGKTAPIEVPTQAMNEVSENYGTLWVRMYVASVTDPDGEIKEFEAANASVRAYKSPTKEQWSAWIEPWLKSYKIADVVRILHQYSMARWKLPVTKMSEWGSTLVDATAAMEQEEARPKGVISDDQPEAAKSTETGASQGDSTSEPHTQPATQNDSVTGQFDTSTSAPAPIPSAVPTGTSNVIQFPVQVKQITTLTGVSILDIGKRLDAHLPPEAYDPIKHGSMSGKTDLDPDAVRTRFDEVFGPQGIGWRITPNPTTGRVIHTTEQRPNKEGKMVTWHVITLVGWTLHYSVITPDGHMIWAEASTTTDSNDNMDKTYAERGALTSLMKQFYRLMGGMNHIISGEYTHIEAARDIAARNRKKAS